MPRIGFEAKQLKKKRTEENW